ncbi:MAG TPA: hypothetical protein VMM85_00005 [Methylomirabilota bacterium]|nr:hypothetical protein [Methylomirabilota bacterium]
MRRFLGLAIMLATLLVACAEAGEADSPAATPDPQSASPSPTTEAATPSPSASAAAADPVDQIVGWTVPFTITTPADWTRGESSPTTTYFDAGVNRWVFFTTLGPDTVEAWVDQLTSASEYTATNVEEFELDGAPGRVLDLRLAAESGEEVLFDEAFLGWVVVANRPNRVWVVDADGETLLIGTDTSEGAFENWVAVVEEALATLKWSD